ncbi:MAG: hypothetical protein IPI88_12635 [Chitinophagaceae bacterium]|nr:hypothetical protein [Chitinophagaceae bacterium]
MIKLKPYSVSMLSIAGLLLVAMGVYFVLLRPPLLPENLRYMQTTLPVMHDSTPGLAYLYAYSAILLK